MVLVHGLARWSAEVRLPAVPLECLSVGGRKGRFEGDAGENMKKRRRKKREMSVSKSA